MDQINLNMGKLLLTRYKGTIAVAIYSVGFSLETYYQMFSTAISGIFTPKIHLIYNNPDLEENEKNKRLSDLFIKIGRIQFALLALIASGLIFFGKAFIHYWAGNGYDEAYYVALLLIIPITVPLIQNVGIEIQRAKNKHQFRSVVYLIMAFINLGLSIFLCQKYGAVGSAIGTAISLVIANGVIMNIYYQKKLNIDIVSFWKNILKMSLGVVLPVACGILMLCFIVISSVWILFSLIIIYTAVYCISMWFFGLNDYEKNLFIKPLKKIFKRKI